MNQYMIDKEIINKLRNTVSDDVEIIYNEYSNVNGKNLWNCICSCMDWIEISVDYLNCFSLKRENTNHMSMNIYNLISAIDIISDAVIQLDRAINMKMTSKPLFNGDNKIFNDSQNDDNEHFKEIRAAFGAHPTSLGDKDEKKFAGWSTIGISTKYDFSVLLYSSNPSIKEHNEFGFKYDTLIEFLTSRYSYIDILVDQLVKRCTDFNQSMLNTVIVRESVIIEDLLNLEKEIIKRRAGDYYKWYINTLIKFFSTEVTNIYNQDIVHTYLDALKTVIDEIALRLQQMDFADFDSSEIIHPKYPSQLNYDFEKVYNKLENPNYLGMFEYHLGKIQEYLEDYIQIEKINDYNQVHLLINAGLYVKNTFG